jgi:outer membrane protein TolC
LVVSLLLIGELRAQQQLSLEDALALALNNNPEIKSSALEVEKAGQEKIISRSLFLPSVYAGGQVSHYFQLPAFFGFGENSEGGKIPYGRFGGEDQVAASVTAVQPLFNPVAWPSLQHAQLKKQQRSLSLRSKEIEVLSGIKEVYLGILVLNERLGLTQESIRRNKKVLQDSRLLFIQGKGLRVDTLRAYTSVKNLEPDLVKLTFAIETEKLRLRALMGVDSADDFVLTDSLTIPVPETLPSEEEVYQEVISSNPEFQALKVQTELESQQVRVASAYRKPTLSVVGQYQVQSQTNHLDYGTAHYPSSSFVGVQLSVPLFAGLSTQARVRQARLSKDQADLSVYHVQENLRARVHQAIANHQEALLRLENTAIVRETAQLSYNIIQYRYKNGISPRLELTDAELALSTAQSNYLEAVYDYLSARIQLRKLTGKREL